MKFLMCSGKIAGWLILVLLNFCVLTTGSQAANINFSSTTLTFSPAGPYSVPRDQSVPSSLDNVTASVSITASGFLALLPCRVRENATVVSGTQTSTPGVYMTGVSGIGVSFFVHNLDGSTTLITSTGVTTNTDVPLLGSTPLPGIDAKLVVYGQVGSGPLSSLPQVQLDFPHGSLLNCLLWPGQEQTLSTSVSNPQVTAITCTVTTPSVSVTLPNISTTSLSSVGQTAGDTRFDIGLNCTSGANVWVTLADTTDPGNISSLLSLTPPSTAKGVKLRILKSDGNPVLFGPPDKAAAGTLNQWRVGPSDSVNDIPLTVQYYRVEAPPLEPGTVNAVATFTMSYQ